MAFDQLSDSWSRENDKHVKLGHIQVKLSNQQHKKNNQDTAQFPPKNKQGSKGKTTQMCVR